MTRYMSQVIYKGENFILVHGSGGWGVKKTALASAVSGEGLLLLYNMIEGLLWYHGSTEEEALLLFL